MDDCHLGEWYSSLIWRPAQWSNKNSAQGALIFDSNQATQSCLAYEKEKLTQKKHMDREELACKAALCIDFQMQVWEMTYRSVSQCHQKIPLGRVRKSPSPIPCWITRQPSLLPWTPPQQGSSLVALHCQSLLALSTVMSLNPKCTLCTPHSSLIFTASCFKSRLS